MELYESLFIMPPSVSDDETNALIEKIKVSLRERGQVIRLKLGPQNWSISAG